jgi:hypothetical protein
VLEEDQRRHECETREWIKRRAAKGPQDGKTWLGDVLKAIEKRRGKVAAERLRRDIRQQWTLGNRGEYGDWRE